MLFASPSKKFQLLIKEEYLTKIEREKEMIRRIKKEEPDKLFIGAAHAFSLYKLGEKNVFIEIPVNEKEIMEEIHLALVAATDEESLDEALNDLPPIEYKLFPVSFLPKQKKEELEKEVESTKGIKRLYNLLNIKRFEKGQIPDFVGTWSLHDLPLRGYFEVYLKEQLIKDYLGDAYFSGTINKKEVQFTKKYRKKFCVFGDTPIQNKILYLGKNEQGIIKGMWMDATAHYSGGFFLCEYSPQVVEKIIKAENNLELLNFLTS